MALCRWTPEIPLCRALSRTKSQYSSRLTRKFIHEQMKHHIDERIYVYIYIFKTVTSDQSLLSFEMSHNCYDMRN